MRSVGRWWPALVLAACTLARSAGPAAADWQYAQWDMTADQVVAASNGLAQPNPDRGLDGDGLTAALVAPYQAGSMSFTAAFLFDDTSKLKAVTLNPIGEVSCKAIVRTLRTDHGAPEGRTDMGHAKTRRWDDVDNDNLIVYVDVGRGHCSVQYSTLPATRPDGKGL